MNDILKSIAPTVEAIGTIEGIRRQTLIDFSQLIAEEATLAVADLHTLKERTGQDYPMVPIDSFFDVAGELTGTEVGAFLQKVLACANDIGVSKVRMFNFLEFPKENGQQPYVTISMDAIGSKHKRTIYMHGSFGPDFDDDHNIQSSGVFGLERDFPKLSDEFRKLPIVEQIGVVGALVVASHKAILSEISSDS